MTINPALAHSDTCRAYIVNRATERARRRNARVTIAQLAFLFLGACVVALSFVL